MPPEADHPPNSSDAAEAQSSGRLDPNTVTGTVIVAVVLCLVCSLLVSGTAVALRGRIEANKKLKMQRNVLIAAGLFDPEKNTDDDVVALFENVQTLLVNLPESGGGVAAGTLNTDLNPTDYDAKKAAKDESMSVAIPPDRDLAGIKRREQVAPVYLIASGDGSLQQLVLPVKGKGLWSTLYGFIALKADIDAGLPVTGITFYEHAETPGLGGEVDNPKWKARWSGKQILSDDWQPMLDITKPGSESAENEVDGLSGATITSNGVEGLVNYWLGNDAFGPFLERFRNGELDFTARAQKPRGRAEMVSTY